MFKVVGVPEDVGGDTIWASGYKVFDRLSPKVKKWVEILQANYRNVGFHKLAKEGNFKLVERPRGHPENVWMRMRMII